MRKGMVLQEIGYAIIALVVIIVVATIFYFGSQKIKSLVEIAFPSEQKCAKTGYPMSTYEKEIDGLQQILSKEAKTSPAYRETSEKLARLYEEYKECFPKEAASAQSKLPISKAP